jgi:hypothetical protein
MRWPDQPVERGLPADSGAADRPQADSDGLARRLEALPASHPSSLEYGWPDDDDGAQAGTDAEDDGAEAAQQEWGAQAQAENGQYGADELAGPPSAGDGGRPDTAGRRQAHGIVARAKGEPYRPWFTAGEPAEPWFTADPGGSPG